MPLCSESLHYCAVNPAVSKGSLWHNIPSSTNILPSEVQCFRSIFIESGTGSSQKSESGSSSGSGSKLLVFFTTIGFFFIITSLRFSHKNKSIERQNVVKVTKKLKECCKSHKKENYVVIVWHFGPFFKPLYPKDPWIRIQSGSGSETLPKSVPSKMKNRIRQNQNVSHSLHYTKIVFFFFESKVLRCHPTLSIFVLFKFLPPRGHWCLVWLGNAGSPLIRMNTPTQAAYLTLFVIPGNCYS